MARPTIAEASALLGSLHVGDPVVYSDGGSDIAVTVPRGLRAGDGGGFGHPHSATVSVGYGPGRWNVEVSAQRIADGYVTLRRPEEGPDA